MQTTHSSIGLGEYARSPVPVQRLLGGVARAIPVVEPEHLEREEMILDTSQEVLTMEEVSTEFIKKVEILLILMSFIFAILLLLLIISIVM